jgi:hypothetical protein
MVGLYVLFSLFVIDFFYLVGLYVLYSLFVIDLFFFSFEAGWLICFVFSHWKVSWATMFSF